MKRVNKERLGSTLDDLLGAEEQLTEVTAIAHKRVLAWQIKVEMAKPYAYQKSGCRSLA